MEYGVAGQQMNAARPIPELGRLKAASERVSIAASRLEAFLERFHGPQPTGGATASPQPPEHYRNDIDSLFAQIDRLEIAAGALDSIG